MNDPSTNVPAATAEPGETPRPRTSRYWETPEFVAWLRGLPAGQLREMAGEETGGGQ
jgi:hypothetical protein